MLRQTFYTLTSKSPALRMLCAAAALFAFSGLAHAQIHVATTGNDTTGDGTAGAPFATISRAFTEVASSIPDPVPVATANLETLFQNAITWATNGVGNQAALIVSNPGAPNPEDTWMQERLVVAGFTVELVDDDDVSGGAWGVAQANAKNLVVIAASIGSANANNLFGMTAPVINCETWSWDNWGYTDAGDPDGDNIGDQTEITIAGTAIAGIVGSLTGDVQVYDPAWTVNADSGAIIDNDIVVDAHVVGDPNNVCLWHAEAGTLTNSPGRTVGFFISEDAGFLVTEGGAATVNIRVASGTYNENDLIMPPSVTLTGGYNAGFTATSGNAADTIINGSNTGAILGISGGGTQVVRHFTIQNANATAQLGAIYQDSAGAALENVLIDNCVISGSVGARGVANITNIDGLVEFRNTLIDSNGDGSEDTPMWIESTVGNEIRFTTCTFTNNTFNRRLVGNDDGGEMTFQGCTFENNTGSAMLRMRRVDGTWAVRNSTFTNNDVGGNRIFDLDDSHDAEGSFVLDSNVFTGNTMNWFFDTTNDTGTASSFSIRIVNNVFDSNTMGGTTCNFEGSSILIANNTFYANTGGGQVLFNIDNPVAAAGFSAIGVNNIFEATDNFDTGLFGSTGNNAWSQVTNNIVFTGIGTDPAPLGTTDGTTEVNAASNLVDVDPLLIDPANGDFHIANNSPAVNAGVAVAGLDSDFEGDFRPQGTGFDIGADETTEGIINSVKRWTIYQ